MNYKRINEKIRFEELPKIEYEALHYAYEQRGLNIPDSSFVELTDWAIQNGLKTMCRGRNYIKVKNASQTAGNILVKKQGNLQPDYYWAGFWQIAK